MRSFDAVAQLWADFIARQVRAGRIGENTAKRDADSLKQVDEFLTGRLSQFDGRLIAQIIRARLAQGAVNATIKRDLNALSSVLNYAIDQV